MLQKNNVLKLHYEVNNKDFSLAGEASSSIKRELKKLSIDQDIIRKVSIATYEAEINMVIHANGGTIDVYISPDDIKVILSDNGPGIPDIDLAMKEGYSTATYSIRQLGFGAGMGLPNMKKYADEMKVTSKVGKGTTIELLIKLN